MAQCLPVLQRRPATLSSDAVRLQTNQTESLLSGDVNEETLLAIGTRCGTVSVDGAGEESGPSQLVSGADPGSLQMDGQLWV